MDNILRVTMKIFKFHNRIKILFIPLLLLGFIGCQVRNISPTNSSRLIFVHEKHGYSLNYPRDWDAHTFENGNHGDEEVSAIFNRHLQIVPAITIAIKRQESATLDNTIEWGDSRLLDRFEGVVEQYNLGKAQLVERNNKEIAERNYTVINNGRITEKKDIYFVSNNKMFIFTYSAESDEFDEDNSVLYEIFDSFTIIDD